MNSEFGTLSKQAAAQTATAGREAPVALYQQVKDFVLRKISDGSLGAGARVPSEQDLVEQLGVARMTANRALRELAEQDVIVRIPGVGSFVAEDKPQPNLLRIASIAQEIRQRGHDHRFELRALLREAASAETASALDVAVGSSVYHLQGLHFENGVPVQLEHRYVNPESAPQFISQDFSAVLPSDYLVRNVPFDHVEHVIDAVLPSPEQAELLQMRPDQPCLMLTRRTWYRNTPVTWVHCIHPSTRYRLGSRVRTEGGSYSA